VTSRPTKVSIGLRVYNGAASLQRALDSLLAQTYPHFELIIADNASTDQTEKICRKYKCRDSRIRYIRHDQNLGPTKNFEYVLKEARYPLFAWASHDDVWDKRFFEKLVEGIEADKNLALLACEAQYILRDGTKMPSFAEGRAFYDIMPPDGLTYAEKVRYVVKNGYGNLIYGIYRKDFLYINKQDNRTVLHGMKAEVLNELPFYINLVLNGGKIRVLPDVLLLKETTANTYYAAALESRAQFRVGKLKDKIVEPVGFSLRSYTRNLDSWLQSLTYHRQAIVDCLEVVQDSSTPGDEKAKAAKYIKGAIWGHYMKVVYWATIWKMRPISK
jgi:glycosyltransferase involved in cell wall biosynthesis